MRLHTLQVNGFKSLVDFKIDLAKFTCLIGLNGAGKSTLIQFVDFLSHLVHGSLEQWLSVSKLRPETMISKVAPGRFIEFDASFVHDGDVERTSWRGSFDAKQIRCIREAIVTPDASLTVEHDWITINQITEGSEKTVLKAEVNFRYAGSVLSQLESSRIPKSLVKLRDHILWFNALGLLSPDHLRRRTNGSSTSLRPGGIGLAEFLFKLPKPAQKELKERLKVVYPGLADLWPSEPKPEVYRLEVAESFEGREQRTDAKHVNDGLLRVAAILGSMQVGYSLLLFDEIENGLNPEIVQPVVDALVKGSSKTQIVVTTHSHMILNFLDDAVARDSVHYLYKNGRGATHAIPFFSIPSLAEKLKVMGPGEAFVDTNLVELADEIGEFTGEGK